MAPKVRFIGERSFVLWWGKTGSMGSEIMVSVSDIAGVECLLDR